MQLIVLGINYRSAPVEVRENFSFPEEKIRRVYVPILEELAISECVILSTCNRTEFYGVVDDLEEGRQQLEDTMQRMGTHPEISVKEHLFVKTGEEAISHLFEVASSLDSLVIGEGQIISQVKQAYSIARECGATGTVLNTLFNRAIHVGKRVRSETFISHHPVSVSSAAVDLARKTMGDLTGKAVMIIGAGQMAELAARHLVADGIGTIFVSNRSFDRARELAKQFKGRAIPYSGFLDIAVGADILITSTGAPHYILKAWDVAGLMADREGRPLLIIDIAVPRDVEPAVEEIPGVTLLNIDSLEEVVANNRKRREAEAKEGLLLIEEEVAELKERFRYLSYQPVLAELSDKADILRRWALKKALNKLSHLSEEDQKVIEQMSRLLTRKILRDPILRLRQAAECGRQEEKEMKIVLQEIFKLSEVGEENGEAKNHHRN